MKQIALGLVYLASVLLFSCERSELIGLCSDNIELSSYAVDLDSKEANTTVTVDRGSWWFNSVVLDDNRSFYPEINNSTPTVPVAIIADWLVVERLDATTIVISVLENDTGKVRGAVVGMQDGNCHNAFTVMQNK